MAFKELSLSTTNKTLPEPAYIHNPTASSITLTVTTVNEFYSTLKSGAQLISRVAEKPKLLAAQTTTDYAVTSDQLGTDAVLSIVTSDVGSDLGDFLDGASGAIFAGSGIPYDDGVQTYEPTTDGSGTGFKVKFGVRGSVLAQVIEGLEVIDAGTGYEEGDTLTFTAADLGTFTRELAASDITDVFEPTSIQVKAGELGDNYKAGDTLRVTLAQTVNSVDYEFPMSLQITSADLADNTFTYVLASGQTTPFQALTLKAGSSTTILAIS